MGKRRPVQEREAFRFSEERVLAAGFGGLSTRPGCLEAFGLSPIKRSLGS
jgi:hypothetical protein